MATTSATATATVMDRAHSPVARTTCQHYENTKSSFNYYGSSEIPPLVEVQAIFAGTSPLLRTVPQNVYDLRQQDLSAYSIDRNGFQVVKHSSAILPPQAAQVPDFHDKALVHSRYWPELSQMLKDCLGVRAAVPINTTVRDISVDQAPQYRPDNPRENPKASFNPFFVVHCDYTPAGARGHMRGMKLSFFEDNDCEVSVTSADREIFFALKNEIAQAEDDAMQAEGIDATDGWNWSGRNYAGPRWAMLSVWRPLEKVCRDPLGVLLGSNERHAEMAKIAAPEKANRLQKLPYVQFERMYKNRPGFLDEYKSANCLLSSPNLEKDEVHTWGYVSGQQPDEVLLLKLFDSEAEKLGSTLASSVGHSAFPLPNQDDMPYRRSAEVRFMVIW